MWEDILGVLVGLQTAIKQNISRDLSAFAQSRDWMQLAFVFPLGIVFGAVHALTPGHSKTILTSYVVGSGATVVRAAAVAAILSVTHILSAVVIGTLALPLVGRTLSDAGRAPLLEDLSRGLVAAIGLWLIVRSLKRDDHPHNESALFGVFAGMIPCPLTLFAMVMAISRGVPEAGLVFALAMLLGVAFTLSVVAMLSVYARDRLQHVLANHGAKVGTVSRLLEGATGVLLVAAGAIELLRA